MQFSASVIQGSDRGKKLGVPTLNLNLSQVPKELKEGIYACRVHYSLLTTHYSLSAVLHYGPRPVFHDSPSCEVHILDTPPPSSPKLITVEIVKRLRDVQNFPSPDALQEQMQKDIEKTRKIFRTSPLPLGEG